MKSIGARIKLVRERLDLSIIQFATEIGVTQATIYRIEGDIVHPQPTTINQIVSRFGVDRKWLTSGKGKLTIQEPKNVEDHWRDRLIKEQADRIAFLEDLIKKMTK